MIVTTTNLRLIVPRRTEVEVRDFGGDYVDVTFTYEDDRGELKLSLHRTTWDTLRRQANG